MYDNEYLVKLELPARMEQIEFQQLCNTIPYNQLPGQELQKSNGDLCRDTNLKNTGVIMGILAKSF